MANPATFIAYIDESGDEGFQFTASSSRWFVLAAIVLRCAEEQTQVKVVNDVRARLNQDRKPEHRIPDKKPLHFRDLKHEQRKFYAGRIAEADLRTVSILVDKPALTSPERFSGASRLYFYAVRLLAERISWYCRDRKRKDDPGDGSVELVFSNRATLNYAALRSHLAHLEQNRVTLDYRAAPEIVRPEQIATYTHGRRLGLQLADVVASAYYYAVQPSAYGYTEESYARLVLPRAYRHQGQLWGYGIKIVPREAEEKRRSGAILPGWE